MMKRFLIFTFVTCSLLNIASATAGTATFYTIYRPSKCYGYEDKGTMIAAADYTLFNNGAACGTTYNVRCTAATNEGVPYPCSGNEVEVTIVDLCTGCAAGQLDLSQEAFSIIANPDAGKITTEYNQV